MIGIDMHPISKGKEIGATGRSPVRSRRSIRLRGYDYSRAGAYFITLCTQNRQCLFGEIVDGAMRLNPAGRLVADEWMKTAIIRHEIELDEWVMMPNHFHGILAIVDGCCRGDPPVAPKIDRPMTTPWRGDPPVAPKIDRPMTTPWRGDPPVAPKIDRPMTTPWTGDPPVAPTGPKPRSVGAVMAGFKSAVTKRVNEWRNTPGAKLWQRNYWEHVIRNESELNRIREYIRHNPAKWELDKLHPNPFAVPSNIRESSARYGRPAGRPYNWEEWMI
jgi:REP element-mobilizing transposase RayT